MAVAVRLETRRILLPGYGCLMWYLGERVYTGIWDLLGDVFLSLSLSRCYGVVVYLVLSFELLWRVMML